MKTVERKAEWPDWTPPPEMIARSPYLPRFMAGGATNPLGARAMYLSGTFYRIHGTNAPSTIGSRATAGCIRMVNDDVIDLYDRVKVGTKVVVMPAAERLRRSRVQLVPLTIARSPRFPAASPPMPRRSCRKAGPAFDVSRLARREGPPGYFLHASS